jgi:hypothetical protein
MTDQTLQQLEELVADLKAGNTEKITQEQIEHALVLVFEEFRRMRQRV